MINQAATELLIVEWWNKELNKIRFRFRKLLSLGTRIISYTIVQREHKQGIKTFNANLWKCLYNKIEYLFLVSRPRRTFRVGHNCDTQ